MAQLTVLNEKSTAGSSVGPARDLARLLRGQVRFDDHVRKLYATDASIYQQTPLGVVSPADEVDVQNLLRYCQQHRIPLLPRGGGTSLAGQCVNQGIVCDLSQICRRVLSFDAAKRQIHLEAGMNIDEINRWLSKENSGLFFAPDPATVAQCAIGGAIGNNAAGARSIRYGRTSENLAGLDLVLSDGEKIWLGPGAGRKNPRALSLARAMAEIATRYADEIRSRFPRLNRRNAGYGIDLVLHQLDAGVAVEDLDLSGLICGSEGTLGVVTSALLKLHPLPKKKGLAIVSFPTLEDAIDSVVPILGTGAIAVELMDEEVLTAAAGNNECRKYLDLIEFYNGELPRAVLYVEYQNETDVDAIAEGFEKLAPVLAGRPIRYYTDAPSMLRAWTLRKAGEPLLHGLSTTRKPLTFVEDNSIPVANLSRFVREFKRIVGEHGTRAAYWAHASVGVLHVRPMIDLHDPADRENMVSIAEKVADLARDCGGVMSGEHGDGRARGPLLERFFGPRIMECFREIKQAFDPAGILNPGMIVGAGTVKSIAEGLRVDAGKVKDIPTYFDYTDQESFEGAVEMCNGAGFCRKTAGGTMCPSYRATMDERHSTRGRGNALRLAISGQLRRDGSGKPDFTDDGTMETLDLCLACKACKSECPSNVDIARLKAEYMAHRWDVKGTPLYARVFGHVRTLNKLGAIAPGMANWINDLPPVRMVMNRVLGLAAKRSLPKFAKSLFATAKLRNGTSGKPRVVLYGDCFVAYNDPHIGHAAIRVLESLGYEVVLPKVSCCGRAMISTGLLKDAARSADQTLAQLRPYISDENVAAVVVAEPSCLASFKDDWLTLKLNTPLLLREKLAAKSFLIEEFVDRFWEQHPNKPTTQQLDGPPVILHGHCHQKALWGDITSAAVLRRIVGDRLQVLPSGCCGMAGSFGYLEHRYDVSMKIGELSVFPPIRAAGANAIVVAPGTSCRHQIHDGTGRAVLHPVELLAKLLNA